MNIWVVTIGEPIPHKKNTLRLHRSGILNEYLRNDTEIELTWWTSTFNHFEKRHIFYEDSEITISPNYKIKLLKGTGYKRNVSPIRIIDHFVVARKLKAEFNKTVVKPDLILCSFPTLGLSEVSIDFGRKWKIPVVIDYRDMWPEVYVEIFPKRIQFLIELILRPLFNRTHNLIQNANSLISITDKLLFTIQTKAFRNNTYLDRSIPLSYRNEVEEHDFLEKLKFYRTKFNLNSKTRICFFGNLGKSFDFNFLEPFLLNAQCQNIEIIICGTGQQQKDIKNLSEKFSNLIYLGYVGASDVKAIMHLSNYGLCPYINNQAFLNSLPGKVFEYLSGGLDIISTLEHGELGKFLKSKKMGHHYDIQDPQSFINLLIKLDSSELRIDKNKIQDLFEKEFSANAINSTYVKYLKKIRNEFQGS